METCSDAVHMKKKDSNKNDPSASGSKASSYLIVSITFIVFIIILYAFMQAGEEQGAAPPEPLAKNDVSISIMNPSMNGTVFQINVTNAQSYTIAYADTFYYYINIYKPTGEKIESVAHNGYCYYDDPHSILPVPPGKTFVMNGTVDTEGMNNGTYYVSADFHLRDYYDNIVMYSSQRMEFTVGIES